MDLRETHLESEISLQVAVLWAQLGYWSMRLEGVNIKCPVGLLWDDPEQRYSCTNIFFICCHGNTCKAKDEGQERCSCFGFFKLINDQQWWNRPMAYILYLLWNNCKNLIIEVMHWMSEIIDGHFLVKWKKMILAIFHCQ